MGSVFEDKFCFETCFLFNQPDLERWTDVNELFQRRDFAMGKAWPALNFFNGIIIRN